MKNEIEADGFITPKRYLKGSEPIEKKKTGRDIVLTSLAELDNSELVGYVIYYMFGFDTEVEFEEYLSKEVAE